MATRVNIVIDQGTDFETSVNLTDATGAQLDMTGMTAAAQIRKQAEILNLGTALK